MHGDKYKYEKTIYVVSNRKVVNARKDLTIAKKVSLLSFDFAIATMRVLIEYQGKQHYFPMADWGGLKAFKEIQQRDGIKKRWAHNNGWHLICVPYTIRNVEVYLDKRLRPQSIALAA